LSDDENNVPRYGTKVWEARVVATKSDASGKSRSRRSNRHAKRKVNFTSDNWYEQAFKAFGVSAQRIVGEGRYTESGLQKQSK